MPRILLLLATTSYKAEDFIEAAGRLGVDVVVGSDHRQAAAELVPGAALELDFNDLETGTRKILEFAAELIASLHRLVPSGLSIRRPVGEVEKVSTVREIASGS